jgi:hypothetical protein
MESRGLAGDPIERSSAQQDVSGVRDPFRCSDMDEGVGG